MSYNQLGFAFVGLRTISYAVIDAAYKKIGATNLLSQLGYGVDIDDHTIICTTKFSFEKKVDQPFLILEVEGLFEIEKEDFASKIQQSDGSFLITKDLATHFAVLTIGSARGVLHAKTESTIYNQYLLPTINVKGIINEDLIINT